MCDMVGMRCAWRGGGRILCGGEESGVFVKGGGG